ncbi:alpha-xenorhabdolysin family binary toxin subunit A [Pseudomonas sp. LB1P83]
MQLNQAPFNTTESTTKAFAFSVSPPVIDKAAIKKIKEYITAAKSLPVNIDDVKILLETETTGIAGLEPYDIADTCAKVVTNANSWNDIELSMKRVAGSLQTFSEDLRYFGDDIIAAIETMPGYQNYIGTIEGLTEEEVAKLPELKIGRDEKNRFPSIKDSIQFIASSIEQKKTSSTDIELRLKHFKTELTNEVAVSIGTKLKLAGNHELNAEITRLNAEIDEAQRLVDEKTRETEPNFFDYFMAFGSPLGSQLLRLKATLQDAHVAPLVRIRDDLTEQVRKKNILTGTLLILHNRLYSVDSYITGATESIAMLETLWITISEYIDSSKNKIDGIHEFLTLRSFVSSLKVVLNNWKKIESNSNALAKAFD